MGHEFEELANAIVIQACEDFRSAMRYPHMPNSQLTISEVRGFFRSKWGYELTGGLAPVILQNLEKECDE